MKKRNFCTEVNRIVYANKKEQTSHCKLDCCINLFPDEDNMVPYALVDELKKRFPCEIKNKEGKVIKQLGLKHDYGDVFHIHIETIATCHSGDTFDEKKGKTIAYSKAQFKLYHLLGRVYQFMEMYFARESERTKEAKEMFARYTLREASFLDDI